MNDVVSRITKKSLEESTKRLKQTTDDVFKHLNQELDQISSEALKIKIEETYEK